MDVTEFLRYENEKRNIALSENNILVLTNSKPQMNANAIMAHYFLKNNNIPSLYTFSSIMEMKVVRVKKILLLFITEGTSGLRSYFNRNKVFRPYFSSGDMRAMNMMISGESIQSAARRYGVSAKTLYSQRSVMLQKLAL